MPTIDNLKPIKDFAESYADKFGVKPKSLIIQIDRNQKELIEAGAVYKTRGKSRMIDADAFLRWYLCH
ncbi:hypothetical protein [Hydrogenovibrio halophilus]|uniref:hypothetical protein n=1 Tax=Hydrogenovibrio halophilus TaxID=373391 RepID=UPI000371BC3B|nr:hypothetical protein [Hydrogenovibrio halophilus]